MDRPRSLTEGHGSRSRSANDALSAATSVLAASVLEDDDQAPSWQTWLADEDAKVESKMITRMGGADGGAHHMARPGATDALHRGIERQARSPTKGSAPALIYEERQMSFAELDRRADLVARHLVSRAGLAPRSRTAVGVCADGVDCVVSILAVLKTGNPYVPLDPTYPRERLRYMIEDAGIAVVLSNDDAVAVLEGLEGLEGGARMRTEIVLVDSRRGVADGSVRSHGGGAEEVAQKQKEEELQQQDYVDEVWGEVESSDLAYIIYTSGSTGRPKGVCGSHGAMMNRFQWMYKEYPFVEGDVCCQKTSINFVDSVFELLGPLACGVPVVLVSRAVRVNPEALVDALATHHVTRVILVPSLLEVRYGTQIGERVGVMVIGGVGGAFVYSRVRLFVGAFCNPPCTHTRRLPLPHSPLTPHPLHCPHPYTIVNPSPTPPPGDPCRLCLCRCEQRQRRHGRLSIPACAFPQILVPQRRAPARRPLAAPPPRMPRGDTLELVR